MPDGTADASSTLGERYPYATANVARLTIAQALAGANSVVVYAQSLNDFLVFGTMTVGSFLSGGLLAIYGWNTVLWASLVPVALAAALLSLLAGKRLARDAK